MDTIVIKLKNLFKLRSFMFRKSILVNIVISYIVIGTILITILSALLYVKFSDNSIQEIKNVSINSLNQTQNAFEILWNTTYLNMFNEFKTNSTLIEAMNLVHSTPIQWGEISKTLTDIVNNNNIFVSIYVYNSYSDMVFSSTGTMMSSQNFYDPGVIKYIKENKNKVFDNTIIYRRMKNRYDSGSKTRNVMSVIYTDDALKSAVIYNIDQDVIQKLVTQEKNDPASSLLIFNRDGSIISNSRLSNIYGSISAEDYVKRIRSIKEEYGSFEDSVEGKRSLITFNKWDNSSGNLGWTFVSINDYQTLLSKVRELRKSIFIIASFFILLSILIAGFFAENIYGPFYRLLGKIKAMNGNDGPSRVNEYDYLKNVYDYMAKDLDDLKTYKSSSASAVKRELLDKILNGKLLIKDEPRNLNGVLKLSLESEDYIVLVFRLDNLKVIEEKFSGEDIHLLRLLVCSISEELLKDRFEVETIVNGEESILIISANNNANIQNELVEYVKGIQETCLKHHEISVSSGIGSAQKSLKGIHFSYLNALEAMNYRFIYGRNSIIQYTSILSANENVYEYPYEAEKNLMDALKAADETKVRIYLNEFIQSLKKYSYDEIILALNQLTLMSIRSVKSLLDVIDMDEMGVYVDYKLVAKAFKRFEVIEEIQEWILKFYSNVMTGLKKKYGNKYEDIIVKIKEYIDVNYQDPNISVEAVSDLVNLSPNYVRTLFKDNIGKSISNYVNDKRFTKARELLIYTNHPAYKIAEMVGFPAGSYFYTAFKKASGVSPDEYRKTNL